jgi:glutathione synthase
MRLLFVVDPLAGLKPYKDSSVAMMRAAAARGHAVFACEARRLTVANGIVQARCETLDVRNGDDWYRVSGTDDLALNDFAAVLMRTDPPVDTDYLLATHLLGIAEANGARVLNRPAALRDFNEKLAILNFPQFTAPTLVSADAAEIGRFLAKHGDIIVKPLTEMGGAGIFRLTQLDPNRNAILETLTHRGRRAIMAQRYLPEIADGDKRILLVDGEPVDYCLARIPQGDEFRGNLAAGGRGVAQPLSDRDRQIAAIVGPELRKRGLLFVGLDVIGDYLTEVNVTSPTCIRELDAQFGLNIAGTLFDRIEAKLTA